MSVLKSVLLALLGAQISAAPIGPEQSQGLLGSPGQPGQPGLTSPNGYTHTPSPTTRFASVPATVNESLSSSRSTVAVTMSSSQSQSSSFPVASSARAVSVPTTGSMHSASQSEGSSRGAPTQTMASIPRSSTLSVLQRSSSTARAPLGSSAAPSRSIVSSLYTANQSPTAMYLSTSATSPTSTSVAKRGLAYTDSSLVSPFVSNKRISWAYNWYTSSSGLAPSVEFVPTFWGPTRDPNTAATAINAGAKYLLTYNEPDMTMNYGGSESPPYNASLSWKSQLAPFANRVALGSPSITSWNTTNGAYGPSGLVWLQDFVNALGGPSGASSISFVSLHWYGATGQTGAQQAANFQKYIQAASTQVNQMFGRSMPIWITEFSPLPLGDQQTAIDFMNAALPFLDGFGPVARYSFFMDSVGNLVNSSSILTNAGVRYND